MAFIFETANKTRTSGCLLGDKTPPPPPCISPCKINSNRALTFDDEDPLFGADGQPVVPPGVSAGDRVRRKDRVEAAGLPGRPLEDGAGGSGGGQASGGVPAHDGLQLERLTYADELDLPGVLLQTGVAGRFGQHVGKSPAIQHRLKKEIGGVRSAWAAAELD
jgi:hypothetical protein